MAIVATDIKVYLSGGAGNTVPDNSLGGVRSTTEVVDATLHNLFDIVSGAESTAGDTEYRAIYVRNEHATLTYQSAEVWIQANTTSTDTSAEISLGTAAIDATEQTIVNESTAPIGTTFSTAAGQGNALAIGNLAPDSFKAIWVKRVVDAGSAAFNNDTLVVRFNGQTAA